MKQVVLSIVVFCFTLLTCGFLYSEEAPYKLDTIVVTASRTPTPLGEAPANVTVITSEEIAETGAQTIADVVQREPGVFTQNYLGNPKNANIDIRGYGETAPRNVLVLINGRRVNGIDILGADLAQVPVDAIERIEIYRGPGSVLYGDNATGGVMNIILKAGDGPMKATLSTTGGSYNFFKPELMISGKQGRFSYLAFVSDLDTQGYRHNNAFYAKDAIGNFTFDVFKNLTLKFSTGHHRDSYGQPGALFLSELRQGIVDPKDSTRSYVTADAATEDNFFDLESDLRLSGDVTLSLGGSYRDRHISSSFDYGFGNIFDSMGQLQTYAFTPKMVVSRPIANMKNTLIFGSDWYKYSTTAGTFTFFFGSPSDTRNSVEKRDLAYYVNDKIYPLKDLVLEAGYRTQRSTYDIKNLDLLHHVRETGRSRYEREAYRFSANYSILEKANAFVSYAKGFRFPATDEFISWGYYDSWSGVFVPTQINSDLKPQTTEEFDVGIRWSPWHRLAGTVTYFQSRSRDEIYYNPLTFMNENYDKTRRQGVETTFFLDLTSGLTLNLTHSYTEASFDGGPFDGNLIPLVPENKISAKLSFIMANWNFNLISVYTGDRYAISDQANALEKLPGYTIFDMSIGYRFKKLAALLTIKNLTDKNYSEIGVYSPFRNDIGLYPSPGRQFFLSLKYAIGGQ